MMAELPAGGTNGVTHATMVMDLVEARKDCICFISPRREDVVGITSSITQTTNVEAFFDNLASSSYAVFDSGYKYMYDRYNDVYRYVPLNGDIAGLCANTDQLLMHGSPLLVTTEDKFVVQLNLHTTQIKHKGIFFILLALTLLFHRQVKEHSCLVTRLLFPDLLRLIESMCVDCSSFLKKRLQLHRNSNSLSSTMSLQDHSLRTW